MGLSSFTLQGQGSPLYIAHTAQCSCVLMANRRCTLSTVYIILTGEADPSVADIRGGNKTNNSSVRLDHLLTTEAQASPTPYTQRRREFSSPEHALKPHHIVHLHIYSNS